MARSIDEQYILYGQGRKKQKFVIFLVNFQASFYPRENRILLNERELCTMKSIFQRKDSMSVHPIKYQLQGGVQRKFKRQTIK